jgi:tetratricopeptide (TPR) repeat protein
MKRGEGSVVIKTLLRAAILSSLGKYEQAIKELKTQYKSVDTFEDKVLIVTAITDLLMRTEKYDMAGMNAVKTMAIINEYVVGDRNAKQDELTKLKQRIRYDETEQILLQSLDRYAKSELASGNVGEYFKHCDLLLALIKSKPERQGLFQRITEINDKVRNAKTVKVELADEQPPFFNTTQKGDFPSVSFRFSMNVILLNENGEIIEKIFDI